MALTPLEALNKVVEDRVAKTQLTSAVFLQKLYEAGRMQTKRNTTIDWDVEVGGGEAAWEPITQDGADTATDNTIPAQMRIGRYRCKHQFRISKVDIAEAATRAPSDLSDLFGAQIDRGLLQVIRKLNAALFTGDGTAAFGEMVGLGKVIDDTFAYAGINPVTYEAWKVISSLNGGVLRDATRDIFMKHDEKVRLAETTYDTIITNPTMATKYNSVFNLNAGAMSMVDKAGQSGLKQADLGYGIRTYNGRPIIEDPMCQGNRFYFMNLADVDLFTFDMATNPAPASQNESPIVSTKAWGMNINLSELPSNNSAMKKYEMYVLPQLRVFNRKSIQVLGDLNMA